MTKTYQTHSADESGQTDSAHKLSRLRIPTSLSGMNVLDIGCNEGYFCNVAVNRGAERVTGIDANSVVLEDAARRYANERLTLLNTGWDKLPDGKFDLILWTSAMHYELDPQKVLHEISNRLSPSGLFILECGVVGIGRKEMVYSIRNDGGLWFPTEPLVADMLSRAGFRFRLVSHPERVGQDPVPRVVYHCRKARPNVMIVHGDSGAGKTSLAKDMEVSATKILSLDHFVSRIAASTFVHSELEKYIKSNIDGNDLRKLYVGIDEAQLCDAYTKLLAKEVASTDSLVVIEGYLTNAQIDALSKLLSVRANVWVTKRYSIG